MENRLSEEIIPLTLLEPGHRGEVKEVGVMDDQLSRLMAMGLCAGRTVEVVQLGIH